jgi:toxin-antitoxin system PIN domain toxin
LIAVDTNILIYAHRRDSEWHKPAASCLRTLAESKANWAIPWPCLHEFMGISTHKKVYVPPSTLKEAITQVEVWLASPRLRLIAEHATYWNELKALALRGKISGPQIHDARIAAICLEHGVTEMWTADRDFQRFPSLKTRNPLIV